MHMKIVIADTYEELSARLADALLATLKPKPTPLVCLASGDSPKGLYEELVRRIKNGGADVSSWSFVGLDEWMNMNEKDEEVTHPGNGISILNPPNSARLVIRHGQVIPEADAVSKHNCSRRKVGLRS